MAEGAPAVGKGGPFFPFSSSPLPPGLGPPMHKIASSSQHTIVRRGDRSCSSPPACHVGVPHSPHILSCSLAASIVPLLVKLYLFFPQVSISSTISLSTANPRSVSSTGSYPPSCHLLYPLNYTCQKPQDLQNTTPSAFSL